jgi:hypothetical protein
MITKAEVIIVSNPKFDTNDRYASLSSNARYV